jgi:hypothetical protein
LMSNISLSPDMPVYGRIQIGARRWADVNSRDSLSCKN